MTNLAGLYLRFGTAIDPERNRRIHALAKALLAEPPDGVTDVIPSYTTLYVEYDRERTSEDRLRRRLERLESATPSVEVRRVTIPVRYDGPDLADVASHAGLPVGEVIARHCAPEYRVYALGFTPGYPFMGEVDPAIRMPRLPVPRARVEANAVAIADAQTGIYPLPSPGGWRILGTALESVYDPHRERPFLLEPGDAVTFRAVGDGASGDGAADAPPPVPPLELLPPEPRRPVFRVQEAGLLDLMVDRGRFLAGRFGLARSGPLDARSARLANALVGNPPDAPVLELNVRGPTLEVLDDVVIAFAGWGVRPLSSGEPVEPFTSVRVRKGTTLAFPSQANGVRGYLAVAGGFESEAFMGSASVDVRGRIGRPLRLGDTLGIATPRPARTGRAFRPYTRLGQVRLGQLRVGQVRFGRARFGREVVLRIEPGPQAEGEALEILTRASFAVQQADRMGIRLEGPEVPGGSVTSEATPLGAIQVTSGGKPLLLLHDRGTIGGYAKPAIVRAADLPRAGQLRPGDRVRFVMGR